MFFDVIMLTMLFILRYSKHIKYIHLFIR